MIRFKQTSVSKQILVKREEKTISAVGKTVIHEVEKIEMVAYLIQ